MQKGRNHERKEKVEKEAQRYRGNKLWMYCRKKVTGRRNLRRKDAKVQREGNMFYRTERKKCKNIEG